MNDEENQSNVGTGVSNLTTLNALSTNQHEMPLETTLEIMITRAELLACNISGIRRVFFEDWILDYGGDLNYDKFINNNTRLQRQYHAHYEDLQAEFLLRPYLCTREPYQRWLGGDSPQYEIDFNKEEFNIDPTYLTTNPMLDDMSPAHFWGPLVNGGVEWFKSLHKHGVAKEALYHNPAALLEACRQGKLDVITFLLDNGANPNGVGKNGKYGLTPLMQTCLYGHASAARLLIERGCNRMIRHSGHKDRTAFMYACAMGHLRLARFLAIDDADLTAKDSDGFTALGYIMQSPVINDADKDNFIEQIQTWYTFRTYSAAYHA